MTGCLGRETGSGVRRLGIASENNAYLLITRLPKMGFKTNKLACNIVTNGHHRAHYLANQYDLYMLSNYVHASFPYSLIRITNHSCVFRH